MFLELFPSFYKKWNFGFFWISGFCSTFQQGILMKMGILIFPEYVCTLEGFFSYLLLPWECPIGTGWWEKLQCVSMELGH